LAWALPVCTRHLERTNAARHEAVAGGDAVLREVALVDNAELGKLGLWARGVVHGGPVVAGQGGNAENEGGNGEERGSVGCTGQADGDTRTNASEGGREGWTSTARRGRRRKKT
jgi:hypothetical protein